MKKFQSAWYRSTRRAAAIAAVGFGLGIVAGTAQAVCVGDCAGDGEVTVTDLIKMVNISLETAALDTCAVGDANNDGGITVNEIIAGVNNSLNGCPTDGPAVCGNGTKDAGEDCDNGGTCMGGDNAGAACTKESDCQGQGVCDALGTPGGGVRKICDTDADCGDAKCVHCMPFGGDGCAANCTNERTVTTTLKPGETEQTSLIPGTSGAVSYGVLTIALPLTGQNNFIVGQEKDGHIPVVQKPDGLVLPRIPVQTLACACVRGVEFKTCGGAQFEKDGSESTDCTKDATLCTGKKPCTSVAGPGNSGVGTIGCQSLPSVNYNVVQDACTPKPDGTCLTTCGGKLLKSDGTPAKECKNAGDCTATDWPESGCINVPKPATFTFTSGGGAGSMLLFGSTYIGTVTGLCTGNTAPYGPDHEFCTADDQVTGQNPGKPSIATLTTGTAEGSVLNTNGEDGFTVPAEPTVMTGAIVSCTQLSGGGGISGSSLVGAFPSLAGEALGDTVINNAFVAE